MTPQQNKALIHRFYYGLVRDVKRAEWTRHKKNE
jgi:hypothetical protein